MSGLLAALMLKQRGWEADAVYERVPGELSGRGAGIVAQPALIAHLSASSTAGVYASPTCRTDRGVRC
jgi:2-polyprenyl-6-methoxyphenol hydroxylase-like FAD-dependent oxidoreductase